MRNKLMKFKKKKEILRMAYKKSEYNEGKNLHLNILFCSICILVISVNIFLVYIFCYTGNTAKF